eukprot:CAMPEP_0119009556 /NCGR_PEP_ID=MMETSP1176-20130426/4448_1 /TAXON_ID=265551 /ORGANISM="Synedropsis recta cf, Strain CCMP1620" /LENGTH=485 /DNA_ID=CAMNT_0006962093 /DNA_START=99 /DNA_END=1556 /DNA_ORIENTATION=-
MAPGCGVESPRTLEFAQTQSREVDTVGDYTMESVGTNMTEHQWNIENNWTLDNNWTQEEVNKVLGKNHHYRPAFDEQLTGTVEEHIRKQGEIRSQKKEKIVYNPTALWWKAPLNAWFHSRSLEILAVLLVYNLCVVLITAFSNICGNPDDYTLGGFCDEDWFLYNGNSLNFLGVVLFLLLAFRLNVSVNRFQESRREWEKLESACRNLTRQICYHVNIDSDKEAWERRRAVAFVASVPYVLKLNLRGETNALPDLSNTLVQQDILNIMKARSMPQFCVDNVNFYLMTAVRETRMTDARLAATETSGMAPLVEAMTALQKINSVPSPVSYTFQLRFFILFWLVLYPLHLVVYHGLFTIFLAFFIDYIILGLESMAIDFDAPFGYDKNALDLDGLCDELQRELEEILVRIEHESRELIFNTWEVTRKNEEMIYRATPSELEMLTSPSKKKTGKQGRAQFVRNATRGMYKDDNASRTDVSANSILSEV